MCRAEGFRVWVKGLQVRVQSKEKDLGEQGENRDYQDGPTIVLWGSHLNMGSQYAMSE